MTSAQRTAVMSETAAAATLTPAWRHLPFYDWSAVRDADDFARAPSAFQPSAEVAVTAAIPTCPAFVRQAGGAATAAAASAAAETTGPRAAAAATDIEDAGAGASAGRLRLAQQPTCLLVGTSRGSVDVCETGSYSRLGSFQAFRSPTTTQQASTSSSSMAGPISTARVTHMSVDASGHAYTVGEDDSVRFPILRIWDLSVAVQTNDDSWMPRLLGEVRVQHGSKPNPVAALAHTPSGSFLAVGLADGTVLLLRGLREALQAAHKRQEGSDPLVPAITLPKFKVAHQPASSSDVTPVTGLGFAEEVPVAPSAMTAKGPQRKGPAPRISHQRKVLTGAQSTDSAQQQSATTVYLYIISIAKIMRYTVLGKGAGTPPSTIDDVGCALGCAAMIPTASPSQAIAGSREGEGAQLGGRLVIARDEAIYVIGKEGREMSLAFEGRKSSIRLAQTHLIIISPPLPAADAGTGHDAVIGQNIADLPKTAAAQTGRRPGGAPRSGAREAAILTVFDLDDKVVAFSGIFNGGIRDAWDSEFGDVCVLSDDGSLTRLNEKALRQKLDILFRKSLYLLAVGVARSHIARSRPGRTGDSGASVEPLLGDIHRKYGDYLYEKGDFEGAISQFVKTIGVTQPSYVIRKFLDAQRIKNLTIYLQELHAQGHASSDHTTLLLNCYAKLKDVAALDRFIRRPMERGASTSEARELAVDAFEEDGDEGEQDALPFDLNTAINVCRQGGYFEHAAYLARRYGRHDEYIRIQIEDLSDYKDAMRYIRSLSIEDAERNLLKYGSALLMHDTPKTTDLMIELCSGAFEPTPVAVGGGVDASKVESKSAAAYLSYLQVGRFGKTAAVASSSANGAITPASQTPDRSGDGAGQTLAPPASVPPPSARIFFSHFLGHEDDFVRFLETVALARWGQSVNEKAGQDLAEELAEVIGVPDDEEEIDGSNIELREQTQVWNTLLELYLSFGSHVHTKATQSNGQGVAVPDEQEKRQKRALALLHDHAALPYDIDQALVTCVSKQFEEGSLYLYERLGMYEEIARQHLDKEEQADQGGDDAAATAAGFKVVAALERYGKHVPSLYALVLRHFVDTEQRMKRHEAEIEQILSRIFDDRLLSPIEVVQVLSRSRAASVNLLRGHLMRVLEAQQADITTNASLTSTYRNETREKQADIVALRDEDQTRVFQQTRCSVCHGQLDLPSVHFMCKHSYHARCLGHGENECPVCAKSHGVILEIRRNNIAFGQRHDLFINEVEEADDGFDVVANMFSKGLLGAQQLGPQQT